MPRVPFISPKTRQWIAGRSGEDLGHIFSGRGIDLERNKFFADGWGFLRNRRPDTYKSLVTNKLVEKHTGLKKVDHYKDEIRALEGK